MLGHLAGRKAVNVKMARHISRKVYFCIPEQIYYVLLREAKHLFVKKQTTSVNVQEAEM
jgi:hypothetical protein